MALSAIHSHCTSVLSHVQGDDLIALGNDEQEIMKASESVNQWSQSHDTKKLVYVCWKYSFSVRCESAISAVQSWKKLGMLKAAI